MGHYGKSNLGVTAIAGVLGVFGRITGKPEVIPR